MDALSLLRAEKQRLKEEKLRAQNNQTPEITEKTRSVANIESLFQPRPPPPELPILDGDKALQGSVHVFPDFVTSEEESFILDRLNNPALGNWKSVRNRRLQCFGGDPVPGAERTPLPEWLQRLARFVENSKLIDYGIDHVLVNEYKPGQGILAHTDGPSYHPRVACLSLGDARCTMRFQTKLRTEDIGKKNVEDLLVVTLEPRSLVIFEGAAYTDALHSIDDVRDGSIRVSLTMRKILM